MNFAAVPAHTQNKHQSANASFEMECRIVSELDLESSFILILNRIKHLTEDALIRSYIKSIDQQMQCLNKDSSPKSVKNCAHVHILKAISKRHHTEIGSSILHLISSNCNPCLSKALRAWITDANIRNTERIHCTDRLNNHLES